MASYLIILMWNHTFLGRGNKHHASYHEGDSNHKLLLELFMEHKVKYYRGEHAVHGQKACDYSLVYFRNFGVLEGHHY